MNPFDDLNWTRTDERAVTDQQQCEIIITWCNKSLSDTMAEALSGCVLRFTARAPTSRSMKRFGERRAKANT
jgi:hypothetical protein